MPSGPRHGGLWWVTQPCACFQYMPWNNTFFYYASCDVANVYPVSLINVIHITIAREAIELSMKELVMDHNGNFNAQQDPLLE